MAILLSYPKFKAFDTNGQMLAGGKLYTYAAGTVTPATTYSDKSLALPFANTNPIILDSLGEAVIWGDVMYKFVLKDANDVTIWTLDNVTAGNTFPISIAQGGTGATTTAAARTALGVDQSGLARIPAATATGTVDAITATFSPAITLADKILVSLYCSGANATTTPTFAPNGLTARTITKQGGQALAAGDISGAGFIALLQYDLANTRWELLNPAASSGVSAIDIDKELQRFGLI